MIKLRGNGNNSKNEQPAEVQQYAPKPRSLDPVSNLGKLGQLCEQIIEELKESKSDALARAETHAGACEANMDYLRNLAKAHHEAEADLVRRFEKATADVETMRAIFTEPCSQPPPARIDEAALNAALATAVGTKPADQETTS